MKEYPISDDLAELNNKAEANRVVVEIAMGRRFGYRKARKAARERVKFERLFWKRVREIYPVFANKSIKYDSLKQTVAEFMPDDKKITTSTTTDQLVEG